MSLGEKIRAARRKCGLSQEQLAEKMAVSRSAIAKWETDKGLPDVGNLKFLARFLNVSVDYLLDEGETACVPALREAYNLAAYGRGCKKVKKDRVVREKFPEAKIYTLLGQQEFSQLEPPADLRTEEKAFYLVEKEGRLLFVTVTDTFVEARMLEQALNGNSFTLEGWHYIRCNYEIGE